MGVHIGGGLSGLDVNHIVKVIGVGLRIMGNFFRIIRIILKRVIGELLDDKRRFLNDDWLCTHLSKTYGFFMFH